MMRQLRWIAIAILGGIALSAGLYFSASQSEPYRFSERWLRQSAEVREKVGEIQETRLSTTSQVFSDEMHGNVREARVSVLVHGTKGSLIAKLRLQKSSGSDWIVKRCQLEAQD
ncbi:MAG TPA: cytochrome c oxidase assembly factor Coa1 family protein [Steroidobacteraceae bacterium]